MRFPEIANRCKGLAINDSLSADELNYKLVCVSVDDPSFVDFKYINPPKVPSEVSDYQRLDYVKQQEFVKRFPDFWSNPASPGKRYSSELCVVNDTNFGHKYNLIEIGNVLHKHGDVVRLQKVKEMLSGYPKQLTVTNASTGAQVKRHSDSNINAVADFFGGEVL